VDGWLVRKSLRVLPAIDSLGAFQEIAIRHMRGLSPIVTLLWASVSKGWEKRTLTCNVANQRHNINLATKGSSMSRNRSIVSMVAAMALLSVLSVVTMAFAEQEEGGGESALSSTTGATSTTAGTTTSDTTTSTTGTTGTPDTTGTTTGTTDTTTSPADTTTGTTNTTGTTTATSTFTPLETVTNVRDFGATGDGTSNDTAAFERAMAEAARVGGVVYVPAPGNYPIASVTPPNNTHLEVQAGAVLKKYGSDNGPLFNIDGPNDTTFANNIHIEGVGGTFNIDLSDAGQATAGIRYRNVRGFSLRNMVCIQNNDNPTQEAPSSRKPCISFLPTTAGGEPIDGELENIHSVRSPYGWGLTQVSGGENLRFFNISSEGGVPLRLENYSNNWTPMSNIVADGVTCKNGHDAVHMNPHGATHTGPITIKNVVADSCESALSIAGDGTYGPSTSIDGLTVIPGNTAQIRDPGSGGYVGTWIVGQSQWCVDDRTTSYNILLSNVNCGGLGNRP
jgi:Pectate lyase superfamily protein